MWSDEACSVTVQTQVLWKGAPWRVTVPFAVCMYYVAMRAVFRESGCLGVQPKWGGIRHPRLNISERPIANKYCEGKLKSTLERESNEHVKLLAGKRWASVRMRKGTG